MFISLFVVGCSNADRGDSRVLLKLGASNISGTGAKTVSFTGKNNENVIFTDSLISIRDVIFKNEDYPNNSLDIDEIQFRGPYQIDLLDGGDALT